MKYIKILFFSCCCDLSICDEDKGYYYSTSWTEPKSQLGKLNLKASIDNPMKGLVGSPLYDKPSLDADIPSSLEFFYIGLDSVMFGNPDKIGSTNAFKWDEFESILEGSASRNNHAIVRFFIHFPGRDLRIPQYLIDDGVQLIKYSGTEISPVYDNPKILEAFRQFVTAFGRKYDGDRRLYCVQLGLIGFWGEWHTSDFASLLPDTVHEQLLEWYKNSFRVTKLQLRQVRSSAYDAGFGLHDDSFGFSTLDGDENGGELRNWFFWSKVSEAGYEDFWKRGPMGGETRPELQGIIFNRYYPGGTRHKQDFMRCVNVTHASWIFHHNAFKPDRPLPEEELQNALFAHSRMGYNFVIADVSVYVSRKANHVNIDVTVLQVGIAPFYYPLSLYLSCPAMSRPMEWRGVEKLVTNGESITSTFSEVPATSACLDQVSIYLNSTHLYEKRKMKFAQGSDGIVGLDLPQPGTTSTIQKTNENRTVFGRLNGVTLMDTRNKEAVVIRTLYDRDVIDIHEVGTYLSIRAETSGSVSLVTFTWNKTIVSEAFPPFAMNGNDGTTLNSVPYLADIGIKEVAITVYDPVKGSDSSYFRFLVKDSSGEQTPHFSHQQKIGARPDISPTLLPTRMNTLLPTRMNESSNGSPKRSFHVNFFMWLVTLAFFH